MKERAHTHAALCHHGSLKRALTVAYVHSQLELVKTETLDQLVFVRTLMSHTS